LSAYIPTTMSAGLIIQDRIAELAKYIRKGESMKPERRKHYSKKWKVSVRTVERYAIEAGKLSTDKQVLEVIPNGTLTKIISNPILSNEELEAILCACAEGTLLAEKQIKINNLVERINCLPNHHDRIYAADRLLRLRNTPVKKNQEKLTGDKNDKNGNNSKYHVTNHLNGKTTKK
jgi:hypothetical protein